MNINVSCKICDKEFKSIGGLSKHLKPSHQISTKDYYDKFIKKEGEEQCLNCNDPTSFRDMGKNGYRKFCSKKCDDLYSIEQTREKRKKEIIDKKMLGCELCDDFFQDLHGMSNHIKQKHPEFSIQKYYDKYLLENEKDKYCKTCDGENNFHTTTRGYFDYCSRYCATQDSERNEKLSKSLKTLFDNPEEKSKIIENRENTCERKYGKKYYSQTDEFLEKRQETCLERYDTEHHLQNKDVIKRREEKYLHENGVTNPMKLEKTIKKGKQTKSEKYGDENYNNIEKWKQTNLENLGVEFPAQSPVCQENRRETCLERYDVDHYSKTKEYKEKQSIIICDLIIAGKRNTYNYISGYFYSEKNQKEIYYRSSYELKAYQLLEEMVDVESYIPEPFSIPYVNSDDITKNYVPDILITYIDNSKELIEIKPEGRIKEEINLLKAEAARQYCKENEMIFNIWTEKFLNI